MTNVPAGRYRVTDPYDGSLLRAESFSCAAGPAGWRYAGSGGDVSVDLTVDTRWRQLRVAVTAGGAVLRGGLTRDGLTWVFAGEERFTRAHGFTGSSPAFLVACAGLLDADAGPSTLRLVRITEPHLAPLVVEERWTLAAIDDHPTDEGALRVQHWSVDDLGTGERREVHLAGDVVVAASGVELEDLSGPPSR